MQDQEIERFVLTPKAEEAPEAKEQPVVETPATPEVPVVETPAAPEPVIPAPVIPAPVAKEPEVYAIDPRLKDDPFFNKFKDAYLAGDHQQFIKVMSTDWSKVSDEQILLGQLEEKYAFLDPEELKLFIEREMNRKYGIGSYDEDGPEAKAGKIQMKVDARDVRNGRIAEQESYKIPELPPQMNVAPQQDDAQVQQQIAAWTQAHLSDPSYKAFETSRVIKMGAGEDAYNYAVEPTLDIAQKLEGGFIDAIAQKNADGTVRLDANNAPLMDMAKYIDVANYAYNRDSVHAALIQHGRMLEKKANDAALRNPGSANVHSAPAENGSTGKWKGDVNR